jgi:hypothetical protein
LFNHQLIQHVKQEHFFKDSFLFYSFTTRMPPVPSRANTRVDIGEGATIRDIGQDDGMSVKENEQKDATHDTEKLDLLKHTPTQREPYDVSLSSNETVEEAAAVPEDHVISMKQSLIDVKTKMEQRRQQDIDARLARTKEVERLRNEIREQANARRQQELKDVLDKAATEEDLFAFQRTSTLPFLHDGSGTKAGTRQSRQKQASEAKMEKLSRVLAPSKRKGTAISASASPRSPSASTIASPTRASRRSPSQQQASPSSLASSIATSSSAMATSSRSPLSRSTSSSNIQQSKSGTTANLGNRAASFGPAAATSGYEMASQREAELQSAHASAYARMLQVEKKLAAEELEAMRTERDKAVQRATMAEMLDPIKLTRVVTASRPRVRDIPFPALRSLLSSWRELGTADIPETTSLQQAMHSLYTANRSVARVLLRGSPRDLEGELKIRNETHGDVVDRLTQWKTQIARIGEEVYLRKVRGLISALQASLMQDNLEAPKINHPPALPVIEREVTQVALMVRRWEQAFLGP